MLDGEVAQRCPNNRLSATGRIIIEKADISSFEAGNERKILIQIAWDKMINPPASAKHD